MEQNFELLLRSLAYDVRLDSFTVNYCCFRLQCEGTKFLTVTLPKLSKAVVRSLELGYFDRSSLTCFAWKGRSLRYFRSLLNRIFDYRTGLVLENASEDAILGLRQFCEYFYKLELEFDRETEEKAVETFEQIEDEMAATKDNDIFVDQLRRDFETYYPISSRSVLDDVLSNRPRFGPGTWSGHTDRYPYYLARVSSRYTSGHPKGYSGARGYFKPYPSAPCKSPLVEDTSDCSELLLVPKDSRGPRTIVREPFFRLKTQLSFFDWISGLLSKESRGRINFHDQAINRELARQSSISKEYCTIDLKEASDRVKGSIVDKIFRNSPAIRFFTTRRTRKVRLPNGKIRDLVKLSGMGSGLTFPIMSLLAHLAITRRVITRTGMGYACVRKQVFTYGDDIIVPSAWYTYAVEGLSLVGLKCNGDKSFVNSHFRESCGGDYWNGHSVGPVRLRLSSSAPTVSTPGILSLNGKPCYLQVERHCRELIRAGLEATADTWYRSIERSLGRRLPVGTGRTPVLCRYTLQGVAYPSVGGNHIELTAIMPSAVTAEAPGMDPYFHLGKFFKERLPEIRQFLFEKPWWESISGCESTFGAVSVPRRVRYIYRRISSYALMG